MNSRKVPQEMPELSTLQMPMATVDKAPAAPRTPSGEISMMCGDAIDTMVK